MPGSVHTHTDGEGEQRFVCAEHMKSCHRAPPPSLSPAGSPAARASSPCPQGQGEEQQPLLPGGAGTPPPCPGSVRGAWGSGSPSPASPRGLHRSSSRGWEPLCRFVGMGGWGGSSCPSGSPAHRSPISPSAAPQRGLPAAEPLLLCRAGVFTSSPGRGMRSPTPFPNPGIPRLPGTPGPPGIPFPSAGSSGVCTHPLPAAVALSLETGSDSGSITFSALSLSGNFCGNPSEIGG